MLEAGGDMRARIMAIARQLYVLRGYEGFSFGDIAEMVPTTRANIHHHYGTKQRLMDELIDGFVADAEARIAHHWAEGQATFSERLSRQVDDLRHFYKRFNTRAGERNVWSPISRIRLDAPILGLRAVAALERLNRAYDKALGQAIHAAVQASELDPGPATPDLVRLLRVSLLSCPPMTQDAGSFTEVAELFAAIARLIELRAGRGPRVPHLSPRKKHRDEAVRASRTVPAPTSPNPLPPKTGRRGLA